eukprot:COSAG02_NODE_962_length_15608_cov_16.347692_14_plen_228_part_00
MHNEFYSVLQPPWVCWSAHLAASCAMVWRRAAKQRRACTYQGRLGQRIVKRCVHLLIHIRIWQLLLVAQRRRLKRLAPGRVRRTLHPLRAPTQPEQGLAPPALSARSTASALVAATTEPHRTPDPPTHSNQNPAQSTASLNAIRPRPAIGMIDPLQKNPSASIAKSIITSSDIIAIFGTAIALFRRCKISTFSQYHAVKSTRTHAESRVLRSPNWKIVPFLHTSPRG